MTEKRCLVIATGGPNASGKSTLIRNLRSWYENKNKTCFVLRSDEIRKNDYTMEQHIGDSHDPSLEAYNAQISLHYLQKLKETILGNFDIVLLDAAHTDTAYRELIENICVERNAGFIGFKFVISKETCQARLQAREDEVEFADQRTLDAHFTGEEKRYTPAWFMIDGEQSPEDIFQQANRVLNERFAQSNK